MNARQRVIERIGGERMVDLRERAGYLRREVEAPEIPGAIDVSALLGAGVFVLLRRGEVVHIGKSRTQLYAKIAGLRSRPQAVAVPVFDQILVRPAHPDEIDSVYEALRAEYLPIPAAVTSTISIERRI